MMVPWWSSQYSTLEFSTERPSASIRFSLSKYWVCSALGMIVKRWFPRNGPSASCQRVCLRTFVECLEMCTNSQSFLGKRFCMNHFPKSLTETNWYELWLWLWLWCSSVSDWRISTCFLCSRSSAAHWLQWWHGFKIWWSVSVGISCRAYFSTPHDFCTPDFLNNVLHNTLAQVFARARSTSSAWSSTLCGCPFFDSVPHLVPFHVFLLSLLLLPGHWPVPLPPCGRHRGN